MSGLFVFGESPPRRRRRDGWQNSTGKGTASCPAKRTGAEQEVFHSMISRYEDYLAEPKALTVEEMRSIHEVMISEIGCDSDALELYDELMMIAIRYASIRAGWPLLSREEKMEKDSRRTSCHNSVITHFNMLARYLKQQGKDAAWRERLGYEEEDRLNRKTIGDFACYLAFVNGINAR